MGNKLTPIDEVKNSIWAYANTSYCNTLPPDSIKAFAQTACAYVSGNQFLSDLIRKGELHKPSLYVELMKSAQAQIFPDGNEGCLIPFWDKALGLYKPVFVVMVRGFLRVIWESGKVSDIRTNIVYEGDGYEEWDDDEGTHFVHRPLLEPETDRKMMRAYCRIKTVHGGKLFKSVNQSDIERAQQASPSFKSKYSAWHTDPAQMWEKTAVRRIAKIAPTAKRLYAVENNDDTLEAPANREGLGPLTEEELLPFERGDK